MMIFQMLFKSVMGMLVGINVGAILGGLLGATIVGPEWVIGAMILGAMAGSLLGTTAGFFKSLNLPERAVQRQPVARTYPVWAHDSVAANGD